MHKLEKLFTILEIPPTSSYEEAKRAYRDLVQIWHPDKYHNNERLQKKATEKLKHINAAWSELEVHYNSATNIKQSAPKQKRKSSKKTSTAENNSSSSENTRRTDSQKFKIKIFICPHCKTENTLPFNNIVFSNYNLSAVCHSCNKILLRYSESRYICNELTVLDTITSLMYTRDGNIGSLFPTRRRRSNFLKRAIYGVFFDDCEKSFEEALELVKKLNQKEYAGFNDWRIPSSEELTTIFTGGSGSCGAKVVIDSYAASVGFINLQRSYWSLSSLSISETVSVELGELPRYSCNFNFVLPVRGGKYL